LVPMMESISAADPQNTLFKRNLGVGLNYLGRDLRALGRPGEAIAQHQKALVVAETLAAANITSSEHKHDVAFTRQSLAEAFEEVRNYPAALENFRKAIAIKEELTLVEPTNVRHVDDLASLYGGLSRILSATGDLSGAETILLKAIPLAEKAVAQSKGNPKPMARLAHRYFEAGQTEAKFAQLKHGTEERFMRWTQARSWFVKSLTVWQDLQGKAQLVFQDLGRVDETTQEVAKCDVELKR
jgi:tetratricopeptide (TPR) repeat protein